MLRAVTNSIIRSLKRIPVEVEQREASKDRVVMMGTMYGHDGGVLNQYRITVERLEEKEDS